MTSERDPVPRAKESSRWLSSIIFLGLVAAGVVAAAVLLWRTVDVQQLLDPLGDGTPEAKIRTPGLAPARPATPGGTFDVAVLTSEASAGFLPSPSAGHARQRRHWRQVAGDLGAAAVEVRTADEIEALDPGTPVVVPVSPCLSYATAMALFGHLRDGGGLVLEGPVATRDEACEWRGWSTLRSLTAADGVRELGPRESLYATVPAGLPLAFGLAPGSRIEMGRDLQLALATDGPGVYWSDFGLSPAPVEGSDDAVTAAVARVGEDGGRMAWFGFLSTDAVGDADRRRLRRLHENALLWAARRPLAEVAPWPDALSAALVVTQDVEAEPHNARALAGALRDAGIPGTFFVVSRLVEGKPEIADAVTAAGEVGTHTVDQQVLVGRSPSDQRVRLERSRATAASWSGRPVHGLRPPAERYDSVTLAAWAEAGGAYVAGEAGGRSAAPELHGVEGADRPMVVVPRVMKDDYNVLVNDELSWARGRAELLRGFRKVRRLGGVAMLTLHTQLLDMGRALDVAADVDSVAAEPGWWVATAGEVAGWWRARHAAALGLERAGEDTLEVTLRAPPDTALRRATVVIVPPGPADAWTVEPRGVGLRFGRAAGRIEVVVDSVAAADSARFRLRRAPAP